MPLVRGNAREACISAASILAKTERDRQLTSLHERFPEYGFDQHKGYPMPVHLAALARLDLCETNRGSYTPVWALSQAKLFNE